MVVQEIDGEDQVKEISFDLKDEYTLVIKTVLYTYKETFHTG